MFNEEFILQEYEHHTTPYMMLPSISLSPSFPSSSTLSFIISMLYAFICITASTLTFCYIDYKLRPRFKGTYYLIHSLCNAGIIYCVYDDLINVYKDPYSALAYSPSVDYASYLTYGLHFYHIISYYEKLRFDDWLHHGLMIFVALPMGNYFGPTRLLGHSLFYTTGLPGMIDYALLFLVRNNVLARIKEKEINRYLNTYIRNPGCTIHAFITLLLIIASYTSHTINPLPLSPVDIVMAIITSGIVFWNGIYFMDQVVGNLYVVKHTKACKT